MPTPCRVSFAASLLFAAGAALAAGPPEDPLAALQAAYGQAVSPGERADLHRDLLATILQRVQRSYATEVDLPAFTAAALKALEPVAAGAGDPADVFKKAINAGLRTLDPYSRYLDPRTHETERSDSSGGFGGLGLELEASEGAVRVVAPMPGSPAARAGVQAGDLIVRVDDLPLLGVPLPDAIARMRGEPGTAVTITIRRAATEFPVALTRETIRRQLLRWSLEGEVLVLRIETFSGAVSAALEQAIEEATAQSPRSVVLDLRGNGGGLLREAVLTADAFLGKGDIVSLRGRTPGSQRSWEADARELLPGVPMVVLVDKRSASAAELVAVALQENGRALVMGQQSFGKGSVQSTYSLGEQKGALKLTTSMYHGPSGRPVQKIGVSPDIELVAAAPAAAADGAAEEGPGQAGPVPPQPFRVAVQQARCSAVLKAPDPALACAVAYLQVGNLEDFIAAVRP